MADIPLPPGMHVILGGSAAGTFRRLFHPPPERLLVDEDVLCCGPTPECDPLTWKAVRHQYWKALVPGLVGDGPSASNDLVDRAPEIAQAGRITVWAATSLSEQLFVAHVIHRTCATGVADDKLLIVQFESLRGGKARILGTGELSEQYMGEHADPVALSARALRDYRELWAALTSTDPLQMDRYADAHPDAGPWLARVPALMRRRFPERSSGLAFWDRMLLREVQEHGPNAARIIGHTMVDHWYDGDIVGDWYLFGRLMRLASRALPSPLLAVTGGEDMRSTAVQLTAFGREVLEGRASSYPANPIEDLTAGVRLSSRDGILWFDAGDRLARG